MITVKDAEGTIDTIRARIYCTDGSGYGPGNSTPLRAGAILSSLPPRKAVFLSHVTDPQREAAALEPNRITVYVQQSEDLDMGNPVLQRKHIRWLCWRPRILRQFQRVFNQNNSGSLIAAEPEIAVVSEKI